MKGSAGLRLNLRMALPLIVVVLNASAARAQSNATKPQFEVASIRPCEVTPPGGRGGGNPGAEDQGPSGSLNLCRPVMFFIRWAYVTFATEHPDFVQITGGPSWIESSRYQINAKAEGNPNTQVMRGLMLQALLEDRFGLKVHRETKTVAAYAPTIARGGHRLRPAQEGCTPIDNAKPQMIEPRQKQLCGGPPVIMIMKDSRITLDAHNLSLDEFSKTLASLLGRPVVNQTGISGKFDYDLEFLPDGATPGITLRGVDGLEGSSIFTAIQEQLGLRLQSTRAPGEFLVIDSIERPSEN